MLISYAGCDDVVPERNGRSCLGDSRVTIHNLERVPGHVKVEMTFERSVSPCEIDVEVQGRRDRVNVVPGGFGTPYATTLIVPGREDVTVRFASTDAPERPTGAHHLLRNVALVRTDAP